MASSLYQTNLTCYSAHKLLLSVFSPNEILRMTLPLNCNFSPDMPLATFLVCVNFGLPFFSKCFQLWLKDHYQCWILLIIHFKFDEFSFLQITTKSFGYHYFHIGPFFIPSTVWIYVSWFSTEMTNLTFKWTITFEM